MTPRIRIRVVQLKSTAEQLDEFLAERGIEMYGESDAELRPGGSLGQGCRRVGSKPTST